MLPAVDALFTLLHQLVAREPVIEVAVPKWLVQRHRLASLAARAGQAAFREDLIRATVDWARIETDVPPLIRRLVEAGVRVAPIKGVSYAKHLYAVPAERPMADVDLLVPAAQKRAAREVLSGLGFRPAHSPILHHAEAWVRGDEAIDLHWNIIGTGRGRIDTEALWSRTRPGWPAGAERLDACDELVFHLVNLTRNRLLVPLIHIIDTARLLEHSSATAAMARARDWNLRGAAAIALRFYSDVLGAEVTRPGGWLGPTRSEIALHEQPGAARKVLFDIATAGSARQLLARTLGYGANQVRELARKSKRVT